MVDRLWFKGSKEVLFTPVHSEMLVSEREVVSRNRPTNRVTGQCGSLLTKAQRSLETQNEFKVERRGT